MKKTTINICIFFASFLMLSSCNQDRNSNSQISIEEQASLMLEDPVVIDYFSGFTESMSLSQDENVDAQEYYSILKREKSNHCNINHVAFEGNVQMEKFAKAKCKHSISKKNFMDKYPNIENLDKKDKKELYVYILKKVTTNQDFASARKKGQEEFDNLSDEQKQSLRKKLENKLD